MPEYIGNKLVQKAMIRMALPYTASGVTVVSSGLFWSFTTIRYEYSYKNRKQK